MCTLVSHCDFKFQFPNDDGEKLSNIYLPICLPIFDKVSVQIFCPFLFYFIVPVLFVKETILSLLKWLCTFVKNHLTIFLDSALFHWSICLFYNNTTTSWLLCFMVRLKIGQRVNFVFFTIILSILFPLPFLWLVIILTLQILLMT